MDQKLLTLSEAAELLHVHPETLRRWDNSGKLVAVKINDRGDRRYKEEDVMNLVNLTSSNPTRYRLVIKYKGFQIYLISNGFENFNDRFGSVASFFIVNGLIKAVFAFAIAGMEWMAQPTMTSADLLIEAENVIKKHIDESKLWFGKQLTFEYMSSEFVKVDHADWWKKF